MHLRELFKSGIRLWDRRLIPAHLRARYLHPDSSALNNAWQMEASNFAILKESQHLTSTEVRSIMLERLDMYRYDVIPWLDTLKPLNGISILEIGCGTGNSTVALGEQGARVTAIDIDTEALAVADARCRAYGLQVHFVACSAVEVSNRLGRERFDAIMFSATLEHMTHDERMESLKVTWDMLTEGSLWCCTQTPNRLWHTDSHTSLLPFFMWLPDDLAFAYTCRSPRTGFRELYSTRDNATWLHFLRRGRGVSFHEFDLAIMPVAQLKVAGDLHDYLRHRNPLRRVKWLVSSDYRYQQLLLRLAPGVPPAFFEPYLDLALIK